MPLLMTSTPRITVSIIIMLAEYIIEKRSFQNFIGVIIAYGFFYVNNFLPVFL
jgi:hypothetical protein